MLVEAENPAHAKTGDRVVISFDTGPLLKATFLIYIFPILCMLAGAGVGQAMGPALGINPSVTAAILGFGALFLALGFMKNKGNQMAARDEYKPKIIRVTHRSKPDITPQQP
jgi:sigma-E factor negative regulatory protein RseC